MAYHTSKKDNNVLGELDMKGYIHRCFVTLIVLSLLVSSAFAQESQAHHHQWDEQMILQQWSCTQEGKLLNVCIGCGYIEEEMIPATGHDWAEDLSLVPANCAQPGYVQWACLNCGETKLEIMPINEAHQFDEWYIIQDATGYAMGYQERKCAVCGVTEQEAFYPDGALYPGVNEPEAVLEFEKMLCDFLYLREDADTTYDEETVKAVKIFQEQAMMPVDGIAWPETRECLLEYWVLLMEALGENAKTPAPSPLVEATPVPMPFIVEDAPTPVPTPAPAETTAERQSIYPDWVARGEYSTLSMKDTLFIEGKAQTAYYREQSLQADAQRDGGAAGVLTFRGDSLRQNAAYGLVKEGADSLSIAWAFDLGGISTQNVDIVYGLGWTGQPAIVEWDEGTLAEMNLFAEKAYPGLREVIAASQDGYVYFLDLADGGMTRYPIYIGYPLKGSVTVDDEGRPLIGFGQGISKVRQKPASSYPFNPSWGEQRTDQFGRLSYPTLPTLQTGDMGYFLYSLIDQRELLFINGETTSQQKAYSINAAFDSAALLLGHSDALIAAGENGLLYTVELNSQYDSALRQWTVDPDIQFLRSSASGAEGIKHAIETSVSMYHEYVFIADAYGALRCIDTDIMETVWAMDTGDNTDAALALEVDLKNDALWLYTGNAHNGRLNTEKKIYIRRLNAMTGQVDWEISVPCQTGSRTNYMAGCVASPVVGSMAIDSMVFFTVNNAPAHNSVLLAIEKDTGKILWEYQMESETVSSPVAVYDGAGNARLIQADASGMLHMLDGKTGAIISKLFLDARLEGSPAVFDDLLVIGTASVDAKLFGIRIE